MDKLKPFLIAFFTALAYLMILIFHTKTLESEIILTAIFSFIGYKLIRYEKNKRKEKARKEMIYSFKKSYDKYAVKRKNSD